MSFTYFWLSYNKQELLWVYNVMFSYFFRYPNWRLTGSKTGYECDFQYCFYLIGGALIAGALLKALAQNAENVETDLSEDISEHAE